MWFSKMSGLLVFDNLAFLSTAQITKINQTRKNNALVMQYKIEGFAL